MRLEIPLLLTALAIPVAAIACSSSKEPGNGVSGKTGGRKAGGGGGVAGTDGSQGGAGASIITTDGGPDANPDAPCGLTTLGAKTRPVQILLVVDSSYSMRQIPTNYVQSKWDTMREALRQVIETSPALSFGLELFPQGVSGSTGCQMPTGAAAISVPVALGSSTASQIVDVFSQTTPGGGTPIAAALDSAFEYFATGAGKDLPGDKVVLLATDGGPNCNVDPSFTCNRETCTINMDGTCPVDAGVPNDNCCDPSIPSLSQSCLDADNATQAVTRLAQANIKTFVVGIPGSDAYLTVLNGLAGAGQPNNPDAKCYQVDANSGGVLGLKLVLQSITESLINTCRLELNPSPPDPGLLNVEIDGQKIPMGPDGWAVDQASQPMAVVLQGATCSGVEDTGAKSVSIVYGCPTVN